MKIRSLVFSGPGKTHIQNEEIAEPGTGEVQVKCRVSGVSSGSEMLIYRGYAPENLPLDEGIRALEGDMSFPLKYGYACVGRVTALGEGCDVNWMGERVFSFHPHSDQFNVATDQLIKLPPSISDEAAIFIANMETAVNLIQDASPLLGERVIIFGQGIVGLMLTSILSRYPLADLITVDPISERRETSLQAGAKKSYSPEHWLEESRDNRSRDEADAADLAFEVSGAPDALNQAIAAVGFDGRIVIGSWYGTKPVELDLGGRFHRDRIQIISSQVSTIQPGLRGRWTKARRMETVLDLIEQITPSKWITHRVPFNQAPEGYQFLDRSPDKVLQLIFTYDSPREAGKMGQIQTALDEEG